MSEDDSPKYRQKYEFEALQSIYLNDVRDLRGRSAWNIWQPLNLCLTLTPQKGGSGVKQAFVQIDLHIKCNHDYPNSVPTLSLVNSKGLSDSIVKDLHNKLNKKALELVGREMIFELAQYVKEFLHQHNKPPPKSFHEEMLHRQKIEQERYLQAQQMEQERQALQRQNIFEEVQQKQQILEMEARKRKLIRKNSENDDDNELFNRTSKITPDVNDENMCTHNNMSIMTFPNRVIHRGRCTSHSSSGCISFSGIDKESGKLFDVGEWTFQLNDRNNLTSIQKCIVSIEQELTYLSKLKHKNLARYYELKYHIYHQEEYIVVNLLREYVQGSNCNSLFINHNKKPDLDFLKHVAKEVLSALDYLHRNNVVHRDVSGQFVILSNSGIKLTNHSIYRRLSDLSSVECANYSKKTDILNFGLFILSLVQGRLITEDRMDIPISIQPDLYDFLKRCLVQDESERFTASKLLDHAFFCNNVKCLFPKNEQNVDLERTTSPDPLQKIQQLSQFTSEQSRLNNEFQYLQDLGKGAFGDVIKVRNNLDGRYYAIKRIKLNPNNTSLSIKIIREVKLLSRLNHENVVRYYNSWFEKGTLKEDKLDDQSSAGDNETSEKVPNVVRNNEFTLSDRIGTFSAIAKNGEVPGAYSRESKSSLEQFLDEDLSSSDEDEPFNYIYNEKLDSDDGIVFQHDSKSVADSKNSPTANQEPIPTITEKAEIVKNIKYLFIQMEFCEKSTLRTAIDNSLFRDKDRVWRLFREIVEGLAHIHQQGMIHRDLKPVNIFLDSADHVKIGDFGLATTSIRAKLNESILSNNLLIEREDTFDESKTGGVGTALYVAPEINRALRVHYNQKVDIYSLGIILFEMCYRPLETAMERSIILSKLRMKETIFPEDFVEKKPIHVVRWLLDHDVSKRPTSSELLLSEYVPPPVLEERELRELVRHTLNKPQSAGYKYLIASCFTQSLKPADNIIYDKDPPSQTLYKSQQLHEFVRQNCIKIFEQHGAQNLSTPLLIPKGDFCEDIESCVKLMTQFGAVVCLPHDLRVSFARYIAWHDITFMRRYSIERVYREKKLFGSHPRELYECALDIVTPTSGSLIADAEILYIVCEIMKEFRLAKKVTIKLNHVSLLKSIFMHFGIKDNYEEVYKQISYFKKDKSSKSHLQNYFISRGLSDSNINQLLNLLNGVYKYNDTHEFKMITDKVSEAANLARNALNDLRAICKNAEICGVEDEQFQIIITPGLVYNIQQYSGMICQFVCKSNKKHKVNNKDEVLAAGGRYDSMVAYYSNMLEQAMMLNKRQSAVGISISLDKLVQVIQREESNESSKTDVPFIFIAITSEDSTLSKETKKFEKSLRANGIKCFSLEARTEQEIKDQLTEIKATHVIKLKGNDLGNVRIKLSKEERFQIFNMNELLENPRKILKIGGSYHDTVTPSILRSDSKQFTDRSEQNQMLDIVISTSSKQPTRKRIESQISTHLDDITKKLSGYVIVLCNQLEKNVIKTLASHLEFGNEREFQMSVRSVLERHQKYRQDLSVICCEIYEQRNKKKSCTIILYNTNNNFYRVII